MLIPIKSDLDSSMVAWVVVAAHPFYAVTRADGQFAFDNLLTAPLRRPGPSTHHMRP